uniref:Tc1-like transposase DDE domain-containing protein n=1 Tax=Hucho hucho TaxID=62062 RepID=A0A4W5PCG0_9TELE
MTQHTSRLCKGYMTKKERDGVLHQMTWPPQSPDPTQIEMVWDELDRRVKEKQPTSAQHMWELLQDCWKSIPAYHRDSDFDVYGMAHCAIDRCSEGWKKKPKAHGDQFQILSGLAESFSSCLVAVKDCAKPERKKDEL